MELRRSEVVPKQFLTKFLKGMPTPHGLYWGRHVVHKVLLVVKFDLKGTMGRLSLRMVGHSGIEISNYPKDIIHAPI